MFTLPSGDSLVARTRGVFYGWWLVATSVALLTVLALSIFQGLGTFFVALERQFGWSRTTISGAFSFGRAQGALLGPFEGLLVDRFGPRRMLLVGFLVMGVGFLLLSRIQEVWQFYAAFIVVTLGSGIGGWLAIISLVNNWFIRRRALAMATAMSGIHLGGLLVPVLALGLESHGFRMTTLGIGVFLLVMAYPVTRVIRDRPEDYGMAPDGDPVPAEPTSRGEETGDEEEDFTVREALRTPAFWTITVVHLASSVSIVSLAVHLVPRLTDMGLSLGAASTVVLTYTVVALPAQLVAGYLADRLPKPPVTCVFVLFQALAIAVIAAADTVAMAYLFAVLYGVGFGGRIPLLTAMRGEYFGRKAFATIMGLSQFPNNLAMIGAPLFAGYMFDTTGTYAVPFATFAALNFLGAGLILTVRRPRRNRA